MPVSTSLVLHESSWWKVWSTMHSRFKVRVLPCRHDRLTWPHMSLAIARIDRMGQTRPTEGTCSVNLRQITTLTVSHSVLLLR